MKIIDENGKLFGKFSVIDAIVVLAVICLCILAASKVFMNKNVVSVTKYEIETEYKIKDIKEFHKNSIKVGDKIYVKGSEKPVGEIIEVRAEPADKYAPNAAGEFVRYASKDSYDVTVKVVQTAVKDSKSGYLIGKDQKLQVGSDYIFDTTFTSVRATALDIQSKK